MGEPSLTLKMTPALRDQCKRLIDKLRVHPHATPFLEPVDPVALGIPDYFDIIKTPMDLSSVNKKLRDKSGAKFYPTLKPFIDDLRLIVTNTHAYNNGPGDYAIRDMASVLGKIVDKFVADVTSRLEAFGTYDVSDPAAVAAATAGKKRPRAADGEVEAVPLPEVDVLDDGGGKASKRKAGEMPSTNTVVSNEWPPGTPQHEFWRGLEATWDDMQLTATGRRIPVLGNRMMDLYEVYQRLARYGGYDVVNGTKGGWSVIFREMPAFAAAESSGSYRIKKIYERTMMEYERRMQSGWSPDAGDHTLRVPAGHTFPPAGCGVPEPQASTFAAAIAKLKKSTSSATVAPDDVVIAPGLPAHMLNRDVHDRSASASAAASAADVPVAAPPPVASAVSAVAAARRNRRAPATVSFGYGRVVRGTLGRTDAATTGIEWPHLKYLALSPDLSLNLSTSLNQVCRYPAVQQGLPDVADTAVWLRNRAARVLADTPFTGPPTMDAAASARKRLHAHRCSGCSFPRRGVAGAALPRPAPSPSSETEDEVEPAAGAPVKAPRMAEDALPPLDESSPLTPASFRGWALCATCPTARCFSCLFPTPASISLPDAAARDAFLQQAAQASQQEGGACSVSGYRGGVSDVGTWLCPDCAIAHNASFDHLPWCNFCCGPLSGPPQPLRDPSMFGAAVLYSSATPPPPLIKPATPIAGAAAATPPARVPVTEVWPALVRCETCSVGMHGICAFRSGAAVGEVPLPATDAASAAAAPNAAAVRHVFYCRLCSGIASVHRGSTDSLPGDAPVTLPVRTPFLSAMGGFASQPTRETLALGRLV